MRTALQRLLSSIYVLAQTADGGGHRYLQHTQQTINIQCYLDNGTSCSELIYAEYSPTHVDKRFCKSF